MLHLPSIEKGKGWQPSNNMRVVFRHCHDMMANISRMQIKNHECMTAPEGHPEFTQKLERRSDFCVNFELVTSAKRYAPEQTVV